MKATTITVLGCACETCRGGSGGCRSNPDGKVPIGTTLEDPDAWRLVRMGVAMPADEECANAANMTEQKMQEAQYAQARTSLGIHPNDFAAYDSGEMVGYYPDGSFRPGPNAATSEGGIIFDDWDDSDV